MYARIAPMSANAGAGQRRNEAGRVALRSARSARPMPAMEILDLIHHPFLTTGHTQTTAAQNR